MADSRVQNPRPPRANDGAVASYASRALQSPKVVGFSLLWLFGLYCCLYASAPVAVTPAMQALYDSKHKEVSRRFSSWLACLSLNRRVCCQQAQNVAGYNDAFLRLEEAAFATEEAKVCLLFWFWFFLGLFICVFLFGFF